MTVVYFVYGIGASSPIFINNIILRLFVLRPLQSFRVIYDEIMNYFLKNIMPIIYSVYIFNFSYIIL